MTRAFLIIVALAGAACGGGDDGTLPGKPIGDMCETDGDCQTGVCWDFMEHDPACFGKICSTTCTTKAECVAAANDHGAGGGANNAFCGSDGTCDLVGTGIGSFACARN